MLAGVTTLLLSALPLSLAAQEGATEMADAKAHAEIGVVESIDFVANTITTEMTTAAGDKAMRTFMTEPTTGVDGLGGTMQFGELTSRTYGQVVVVEFVPGEDHPLARRLFFPATRNIRMSQGTIASIDEADQELILSTLEGPAEVNVGIGYGPVIDSPYGLLDLDDLDVGQEITVYYSDTPMDEAGLVGSEKGAAYLIFRHS